MPAGTQETDGFELDLTAEPLAGLNVASGVRREETARDAPTLDLNA